MLARFVHRALAVAAFATLSTLAFADTTAPTATKGMKSVVLPSGLEYIDLRKGSGAEAKPGKLLKVHYTGWLADSKKKFDSSVDRHEPIEFGLGAGMVIKGWDEGIQGMKVGGRRQLTIPAHLAYGNQSPTPAIKPGETLIFVVDLLGV